MKVEGKHMCFSVHFIQANFAKKVNAHRYVFTNEYKTVVCLLRNELYLMPQRTRIFSGRPFEFSFVYIEFYGQRRTVY